MIASARRPLLRTVFGVVPLLASLWTAQPTFAATPTATPAAIADISVTLSVDHAVRVGREVTYSATMTNHGPDDATFVDVVFRTPGRLQLVSMTCARGISPDGPACEYSTLKAGETVVSKYSGIVGAPARRSTRRLTVSARVLFEVDCSFDPNCTFDPNLRNNVASLTRG